MKNLFLIKTEDNKSIPKSKFHYTMKFFFFLCISVSILFTASTAWSAVYYIDYETGSDSNSGLSQSTPWKKCPGMVGFSGSYSHSAGDIFNFKRGVTWPSSCFQIWTISNSGTPGNYDEYTSTSTYAKLGYENILPKFDGGGNAYSVYWIKGADDARYVKISYLRFQNLGTETDPAPNRLLFFQRPYEVYIHHCEFKPYGGHGIVLSMDSTTSSNVGRVYIFNNDFEASSNFIECGNSNNGSYPLNGLYIYNNNFHDAKPANRNGDHCDGIHLYPNQYYLTNVEIHHNKFYGDMGGADSATSGQGLINCAYGTDGIKIYNNLIYFDNTSHPRDYYNFNYMIGVRYSKNIYIYNNTVVADANTDTAFAGAASCIELNKCTGTIEIKNNILSGAKMCINDQSQTAPFICDYNILHLDDDTSGWISWNNGTTFAEWQASGYDLHGSEVSSFSDLHFMDDMPPFDLQLKSDSPAINTGTDLSSIFTDDFSYRLRSSNSWDVGAYEGGIGPPKALRIVSN